LVTRDDNYEFNQFDRIRRCNLIIEKATASTGLSDNDKKELVAEAKFLRASIYYFLARRFGIVVWIDHLLMPEEEDFKLPTTPDAKTSYGYIIKDLEEAAKDMPEETPSGRANRYAALALLSEVSLQAAAYTDEASLYQKSIDAADAVINSGKYVLDPEYEGIFNEKGRFSQEIILGAYRSMVNTACNNIRDLQQGVPNIKNDLVKMSGGSPLFKVDMIFEAWLEFNPSQNIVDEYEVVDQADPSKAVRWDQSSQFLASVQKVAPPEGVIEMGQVIDDHTINDLIYQHRDNRFYGSIIYDSCQWFNETVTTCILGNACRNLSANYYWGTSTSNYYWRKGVYNVQPRIYAGLPTDYHYVLFRLGRVYLNKAEALLRQGKVTDAVAAFNETRTVHGQLPPSTASTLEAAWTDYKRERRVDLAKEGDYYWSLLRWGKYGGPANNGAQPGGKIVELTVPPTLIDITKDRKQYSIEYILINQNNSRAFDEGRRYLFPIPQSLRVRNENLGQNPGY
jgi:hypothetical protein